MKHALRSLMTAACLLPAALSANTAPTVVIQSATMRPGTTLMDVVFRVNDPDDATVKTRALAFIDGERSFAKVIRPVTFVEGTAAKLGDAIPANVNHTLTWDVGADWNIDLGQIKFEVLAMDGRGLLPFEWITIPAAGGKPELTVSKNSPTDGEVLDALLWQYASGDSGLSLDNGILYGNASNGVFDKLILASGSAPQPYSTPFIFKRMNLDLSSDAEVNYAAGVARAEILQTNAWHAANRPYTGLIIVDGWGSNNYGQTKPPSGVTGVTAISVGDYHSIALKSNGTVVGWGYSGYFGWVAPPADLIGVTAIDAGGEFCLALKNNGMVIGWGGNSYGQAKPPVGLTGVTAIAAGYSHSLALKSDGTVVGWGNLSYGIAAPPVGLTGVSAIAAGVLCSLALKSDGTVVAWGPNSDGQATPPVGLTGVTAIASGYNHNLALKSDGTVVGWGSNSNGQATPPAGLTEVIAIAAGRFFSLALKSDGTVVGWGLNNYGQANPPVGMSGVTAIAAGAHFSLVIKAKAP
jgi:hypothetical protein